MIKGDYHTHTVYCDGKNTPEEMVLSALSNGMDCLGFSGHAYTPGDESYCMLPGDTKRYVEEIYGLKAKYEGKIRIYCGLEWDLYSKGGREGIEYLIGSVHYIEKNGRLLPVDEDKQTFMRVASEVYGGDFYALCEDYYREVSRVVRETGAGIIGHFDLVTKFNEGGAIFDTSRERYRDAWRQSADELLKCGVPFEINTGAISRGYRNAPYPSDEIIDYIAAHGGSFILSSDSHSSATLMAGFGPLRADLTKKGYTLLDKPVNLV